MNVPASACLSGRWSTLCMSINGRELLHSGEACARVSALTVPWPLCSTTSGVMSACRGPTQDGGTPIAIERHSAYGHHSSATAMVDGSTPTWWTSAVQLLCTTSPFALAFIFQDWCGLPGFMWLASVPAVGIERLSVSSNVCSKCRGWQWRDAVARGMGHAAEDLATLSNAEQPELRFRCLVVCCMLTGRLVHALLP